MLLFGLMRPLTLLFGVHMVSYTTIVIAGFMCIATGSKLFGKLADIVNRPALLLVALLFVLAVFLILHTILFRWLTEVYSGMILKYYPGAFGNGVIRLALTFVFLLIPLSSLGGFWPLLFRIFVKNIDLSGKFMSASVFWISIGILCGIPLTVFFVLPTWGMPGLFYFPSFIFLLMLMLTILWSGNIRKRDYHSPYVTRIEKAKKSIRFKKKRIVLEAGVKLTRAMLNGYAFQFFAFFALLIVSYRILISFSKIQPWFTFLFIAIVIAGIALGSILYKLIAEKPANKFMTLATLQVISGFGCLFSFAFFKIMSGSLVDRFGNTGASSDILVQQSVMLSVFLLIPSVIQGISIPLAGKLYPKRLPYIGKSFGKLGSLVCLSFCSAMVITPFIVIPLFGLQMAFFGLALLILLSGIYLISRDSRLIRVFRIGYAFTAVILFIVVAALFLNRGMWQRDAAITSYIEGSTATVMCRENNDSSHFVFLDGGFYFGTGQNYHEEQLRPAIIPFLLNPEMKSALVTGFGTGLTAHMLNKLSIPSIYITETFPEIIKLSPEIFSSINNDVLTASNVDVSVEDSRSFLFRTQHSFDLITSGIDHFSRFPGEFTEEYYKLCFEKLSDKGLLCQIIPVERIFEGAFKPAFKSASAVFGHVSLWYLSPSTLMMMASKNPILFDYCRITDKLQDGNISEVFPDADLLISQLILSDAESQMFTQNAQKNTDAFPYLDFSREASVTSDLDYISKSVINFSGLVRFQGNCTDSTHAINRISRLNHSLLQQVSPSSLENRQHNVDFSEWIDSPIQQYL